MVPRGELWPRSWMKTGYLRTAIRSQVVVYPGVVLRQRRDAKKIQSSVSAKDISLNIQRLWSSLSHHFPSHPSNPLFVKSPFVPTLYTSILYSLFSVVVSLNSKLKAVYSLSLSHPRLCIFMCIFLCESATTVSTSESQYHHISESPLILHSPIEPHCYYHYYYQPRDPHNGI